ncbi:hypothetical protein [Gottfriedia acidiceleris]
MKHKSYDEEIFQGMLSMVHEQLKFGFYINSEVLLIIMTLVLEQSIEKR